MGKTVLGIILGGIVAYAWSSISWMALPFHMDSLQTLSNEAAVAEAIVEGAEAGTGIYLIPGDKSMSQEEKNAAIQSGPMIFAAVRPGENSGFSMNSLMIRGLSATLVSALILGLMLVAAAPRLNYIGRVFFVTLGGAFAAISAIYPNQIWWEFSTDFVSLNMIDQVVAWFLGGLVMAGLIRGS